MSFDVLAYSAAFDRFILCMEKMSANSNDEITTAIKDLCAILRVGTAEVRLFASKRDEEKNICRNNIVYSSGSRDEKRFISVRELTGDDKIALYTFYQREGEEDWTEEERFRVNVLQKAMFAFNGRLSMLNLVEHLTFYDKELGIYNINFFAKTAESLIDRKLIGEYGACYFNFKRFSIVNQNLGREHATEVMRNFASILQEKLSGPDEIVCRVGSDNFVVLFRKDSLGAVTDVLSGTAVSYGDNNQRIFLSAYAGYYMIPDECRASTEIIDNINTAINTARNVLKVNSVFFDDKLRNSRNERKTVEDAFRESIENEEFRVYYQPKVDLRGYTLNGAEALCRWFHNGEMIPPYRFIPALEQSKSICTLDFYMLDHVCRDIRRWIDNGMNVVPVSVNLSRRHMGDLDLLDNIISIIDRYNVPHRYIEIELTETTTDVDFNDLRRIVEGLRDAGICTAVDDFGIGYSSLNLIKELPWNVLKIDKSFLPDETDAKSQKYAMLKHIIALVQDIGLQCIIEGVETAEHVRLLKENNCFLAQGFFFDKPLPVSEFEKRLNEI